MGCVLSLPKGSARNGTAVVGGVAVFAACLPPVRRGGGRALGREPVVSTLLWGEVLLASSAD